MPTIGSIMKKPVRGWGIIKKIIIMFTKVLKEELLMVFKKILRGVFTVER